jgi:hypothetical protein
MPIDKDNEAVPVFIIGMIPAVPGPGWIGPATSGPDPVSVPNPVTANPYGFRIWLRWRGHYQHWWWSPAHGYWWRLLKGRLDIDTYDLPGRRFKIDLFRRRRWRRFRCVNPYRWRGVDGNRAAGYCKKKQQYKKSHKVPF